MKKTVLSFAAAFLLLGAIVSTGAGDKSANALVRRVVYPTADQCWICSIDVADGVGTCEITNGQGFEQCVGFGDACMTLWSCNDPEVASGVGGFVIF